MRLTIKMGTDGEWKAAAWVLGRTSRGSCRAHADLIIVDAT